MADYLQYPNELSESGDKDAQIILVFKLIYEFDRIQEACDLCFKWIESSPIFKALVNFLVGVIKPQDVYDNKRNIAFDMFKSMSTLSDETLEVHYACYMIGRCYQKGFIVNKDLAESIKWYEKSANKGNELANFKLGDYYLSLKKYDDAILSYEKAVKYYNSQAISQLIALDRDEVRLKNPFTVYQYLLKFGKNCEAHVDLMRRIIFNNNLEWTIDNHLCWTNHKHETIVTGFFHVKTLRVVSFNQQVKVLLLISKFRQFSHLPYLGILNKVIVVGIIKQLADIWCDI